MYTQQNIIDFEQLNRKKALKKDGNPSKLFLDYLNSINKTVNKNKNNKITNSAVIQIEQPISFKNNQKVLQYTDKDIIDYERAYRRKALDKNNQPRQSFLKWLVKDNKHILKKTIMKFEKENPSLPNSKLKPVSYEVEIGNSEFESTMTDLIKKANKVIHDKEAYSSIMKQIKDYTLEICQPDFQNKTDLTNVYDELAQNIILDKENYIAYIYFFWSAETMNAKPFGLKYINPLFQMDTLGQTFYLFKPAMIIDNIPIYFLFNNFPYSIDLQIKDDMIKLTEYCIKNGYTSDVFFYMEKNKHYIRTYGFNKIPRRIIFQFIIILLFCLMLEYVVLLSWFGNIGVK